LTYVLSYLNVCIDFRDIWGGKGGSMADILIGTCGYSYHEWVGPVYPGGTKPGGYLRYEAENRRYLDKLLAYFKGVPAAVEFRNAEWTNERAIEGLRKRGTALVVLDMPELRGLPPLLDVLTAPFAYIRLHGRNRETWWGPDGTARYDYLYTDKELEAWAGRIERIAGQAQRILVYFNNHPKGQAAKNAQTLEKLLKNRFAAGLNVPLTALVTHDNIRYT
jgi:uncharacterized protein YecE (DUF72 family)